MPLLSWIAGLVAPPLRIVPLRLFPASPVASTAALTGIASGASGSRLELVCAVIYVVVTALLLTRFLTGLWIGVRLRRRASIAPTLQLGHLDVRVSDAIRSPASFASTILLPLGYETWDTATLDTVLAHEKAHVCNLDCYRLWLAALYRAVFWFDPLAHWLHWRLRTLSELTSDEAAATAAGDRAAYAATLKQMASAAQFIPSTVAMADSRSLSRRLRRLVSEQGSCPPLARPWRALLMSAVLVMVMLVAVPWAGAVVPAVQRPTTLEFHLVDEQNNPVQAQQGGELPSGYLAARFQHSWPTTTRHLRVLEKAGLVEVRREGRSSHYRLERERLLRVVEGWLANLRPPTPEQKWLSAGPKSTRALALRQGCKTTKSKSKGKRR